MHLLWSSKCVEINRTENLSRGMTISTNVEASMTRGGKLGDDGRKRRSWGSGDDEGRLTQDNLHNEDLRIGGPYLCSIPTANLPVPRNHIKFRLACLETHEGREFGQKILNIIDKYHLDQRAGLHPRECAPTVLIMVDRSQDWTETREKVVSILKERRLQMLAVEIVMDRPVYQTGHKGISAGLLEGLLKNDGGTMATESTASSRSLDSSGTLGCFLNLKHPSSDEWRTFALTCWHVVLPPFAGLSDEKDYRPWRKQFNILKLGGIIRCVKILNVRAHLKCSVIKVARAMKIPSPRSKSKKTMFKPCMIISQKATDYLGAFFSASGFKWKNLGLELDGVNYPINLDWAFVQLSPALKASNEIFDPVPRHIPGSFAPRSILRRPEMYGNKVFMHGCRSGDRIGAYNGLPVATIEAEIKEGVITMVPTLGYSITGLKGDAFSIRGDSGAMIGYEWKTPIGNKIAIVGMVIAGFEKEPITRFARVDFLVDDIKETSNASDIELLSFF
ncbi:hypothetical protein N7492_004442 [Penicillium capsulatum]|uniref:Uncharacterized protein n=1 Tax=Penicillium capsulatum TaxID=69766 RepID=A0A9W9LQ20_9EURO|nr:hypothetical protein N7492_004442 [Penicillium capsulatum]